MCSSGRSNTVSLNKSVVLDLLCLQGRHEVKGVPVRPWRQGGISKQRGEVFSGLSPGRPWWRGEKSYSRHPWLRSGGPGLCSGVRSREALYRASPWPAVEARRELLTMPPLALVEASLSQEVLWSCACYIFDAVDGVLPRNLIRGQLLASLPHPCILWPNGYPFPGVQPPPGGLFPARHRQFLPTSPHVARSPAAWKAVDGGVSSPAVTNDPVAFSVFL